MAQDLVDIGLTAVKYIAGIVTGAVVATGVIAYLLTHPEKVDIWASLIYRMLNHLSTAFGFAQREYVRRDLQGRINRYVKRLSDDAPFLRRTERR